jgi:deoxyribose-phosphate aldolase
MTFGSFLYDKGRVDGLIAAACGQEDSPEQHISILKHIVPLIDFTTLEGTDNPASVAALCQKALSLRESHPDIPPVAAICVFPALVRTAKSELRDSGIKVASVAGGFPSGQTSLKVKLEEIRYALDQGADELDVVISRGKMLAGSFTEVFDELAAMREASADSHLKVILETGELVTPGLIRKAGEIAISAGADFIKTSTGKIPAGATPEAFIIMLQTVGDYLEHTGKSVGVKASGGIRTAAQALVYYRLTRSVMGEAWLTRDYFRIGASSLLDNIFNELEKSKPK